LFISKLFPFNPFLLSYSFGKYFKHISLSVLITFLIIFTTIFVLPVSKASKDNSKQNPHTDKKKPFQILDLKWLEGKNGKINHKLKVKKVSLKEKKFGFFSFSGIKSVYMQGVELDIYLNNQNHKSKRKVDSPQSGQKTSNNKMLSSLSKIISLPANLAGLNGERVVIRFHRQGEADLCVRGQRMEMNNNGVFKISRGVSLRKEGLLQKMNKAFVDPKDWTITTGKGMKIRLGNKAPVNRYKSPI